MGPFYEDIAAIDRSLYWHAMNTSKRAITLHLEAERGRELWWRLLATADIVVESCQPGTLARWGCDCATIYGGELGLSEAECAALQRDGII